jgi:hypothetical protein
MAKNVIFLLHDSLYIHAVHEFNYFLFDYKLLDLIEELKEMQYLSQAGTCTSYSFFHLKVGRCLSKIDVNNNMESS